MKSTTLASPQALKGKVPDYRNLIRVKDLNQADQWGGDWQGEPEGHGLVVGVDALAEVAAHGAWLDASG
jgi:hypothetical protein